MVIYAVAVELRGQNFWASPSIASAAPAASFKSAIRKLRILITRCPAQWRVAPITTKCQNRH